MGIAVYYNCCCDNIIIQYKLNSYNGLSKFNYNSIRLAKQYFLNKNLKYRKQIVRQRQCGTNVCNESRKVIGNGAI